ncbi:Uncharacterised protein [Wolinella succinogenes]|nr:Uncharacterised protein [Wolinella succinogenes]VEG82060.1 Uncharacterised protein [Wolinella succinogenes]
MPPDLASLGYEILFFALLFLALFFYRRRLKS